MISSHLIDYVGWTCSCFPWGLISTTHAISAFQCLEIIENESVIIFPLIHCHYFCAYTYFLPGNAIDFWPGTAMPCDVGQRDSPHRGAGNNGIQGIKSWLSSTRSLVVTAHWPRAISYSQSAWSSPITGLSLWAQSVTWRVILADFRFHCDPDWTSQKILIIGKSKSKSTTL